jgi:hypothetical protein
MQPCESPAALSHLAAVSLHIRTKAWCLLCCCIHVQVWLLAETGWEPPEQSSPAPAAAAAAAATASPVLTLLRSLALQGSCSKAALAAAHVSMTASSNLTPAVLQQIGLLAALPAACAGGPAGSAHFQDCADSTPGSSSRQGGVHELLARSSQSSSTTNAASNSSSQIAGRVTHLLQRIAQEKVVRRNLTTTHNFMEGVGWSLPRPTTPTASVPSSPSAQLAASAVTNHLTATATAPAMLAGTAGSLAPGALSAAATAPATAAGMRSSASGVSTQRHFSATTSSSKAGAAHQHGGGAAMHRAASAPAPAHTAARRGSSVPLSDVNGPDTISSAVLTAVEAADAAANLQAVLRLGQGTPAAAAASGSSAGVSGQGVPAGSVTVAAAAGPVPAAAGAAGATAAAAAAAPAGSVADGSSSSGGPFGEAAARGVGVGVSGAQGWAAELSQLRSLLETPTRTNAGEAAVHAVQYNTERYNTALLSASTASVCSQDTQPACALPLEYSQAALHGVFRTLSCRQQT